ncbi:hypothetical protein SLA2020_335440 [Shorea laevis]
MACYWGRGGPLSSARRRKQPSLTAIEALLSAGLDGSHGGSTLALALVMGPGPSKVSKAGIGLAYKYWSRIEFGGLSESSCFSGGDGVGSEGWFFPVRGVYYASRRWSSSRPLPSRRQ